MTNELLIIDGTALVIRPWFASASDPARVALYTVRRHLERVSHLAVVVDRTVDTFRRSIDPRYKAHRPPAPPELIEHFDRFEAEVTALGVPVFGDTEVEADDMAATLVRLAGEAGLPVRILASDKDLFQLVRDDPPVIIEDHKGKRTDRAGVIAKLGVPPERVVDYQALVGDKADGIQGVKGVGAKTAAALLGALGSLDALYADLEAVRALPVRGARTLPEKLAAGREEALLARTLATLRADAEVGPDALERCQRQR